MKCLNFWNFVVTILIWFVSFRSFNSCTILENSICYTGFLVHLGRFHHCNLASWTQAQTGRRGFYLPCSPDKFSKYRHENACFILSKKSSEFLFFFILFSAGIHFFKVWFKRSQNRYIFSFSILKWHVIVETNRNKLFFKDEHSYK